LSSGIHFQQLKTQLAVFWRTQKSALRDGLNKAGKNGFGPFIL
jgi:hypothetical protein